MFKSTFLVFFLMWSFTCFGNTSTLILDDSISFYWLEHFEVLIEPKGQSSFETIRSESKSTEFYINEEPILNLGLTDDTIWIRFQIHNTSLNHQLFYIDTNVPDLEEITLFWKVQGENWQQQKGGRLFPRKTVFSPTTVFPIKIPSNALGSFYMKFYSSEGTQINLSIQNSTSLLLEKQKKLGFVGVFNGILLIMFFYNLFLYFSIKDSNYLFYIIYIAALALLHMTIDGIDVLIFFDHFPWWAKNGRIISTIALALAVIQFSQNFLQTQKRTAYFHYFLNILKLLSVLAYPLWLLHIPGVTEILPVFWLFETIVIFAIAVYFWKLKYREARFFLIARAGLLLGIVIILLQQSSWLPVNGFTDNAFKFGSIFEVLLFAYSLVDKINILKKEHEELQEEVLEIQRKTNDELEEKVRLRTNMLNHINQEMEKELDIAAKFQQEVLFENTENFPFLNIASVCIPYGKVTGDIFDTSSNRENEFCFFLGDATGHGISAAFMTILTAFTLKKITKAFSTNNVVASMNKTISALNTKKFVTGIYMKISPLGVLKYCNAGHPWLILIPKEGEIRQIKSKNGFPIGIFENVANSYQEYSFQLNKGDRVLLYTDGVVELESPKNVFYGIRRLLAFLNENRDQTPQSLLDSLLKVLTQFAGEGTAHQDDLTMFCLEYRQES